MSILQVEGLTKNFGGLTAVANVSINVEKGELLGLIGPNGAGKTTFFNLITGVYSPSSGTITLTTHDQTHRLNNRKPDTINGLGLARTFQNIRLFKDMSVVENVMVGMHRHQGPGLWHALCRTKQHYECEVAMRQRAMELLDIFGLAAFADDRARNLAYGEQRQLEIARALATHPQILFLDEPAAGMNPQETGELKRLIQTIRDQFDLTVVVIEHDMSLVMDICERIYVLEYGRLIAEGTPEQIQSNDAVIKAYLGGV